MVWDAGADATAVPVEISALGSKLRVGPEAGCLPAHLMTVAADSCFMSTLLRLAQEAGVKILGYVSNSKLRVPIDSRQPPSLTLFPCIVVESQRDAEKLGLLCQQAVERSHVCRVLGDRLEIEPDIEVVTGADEVSEP